MSNAERVVSELNQTISKFTSSVDVKIENINRITDQIKKTADMAYNEISKFKVEMIENEQVQSARENILRIDQVIKEQFSDYDRIRRTVMGVVKDFDINLVRNATIARLSEELWITSSRYWLSYTLITLSAWINDSKTLAYDALQESFKNDQQKTAMFFCLMNLRFQRAEPAKHWLIVYLDTLSPEDIQNETAVLLHAYINGVFGIDKGLESIVSTIVNQWMKEINTDENIKQNLVKLYRNYINNLNTGKAMKSEYISRYCINFEKLKFPYIQATKYDEMIQTIQSVDVDNLVQNADNYKQRVDAILSDLITNYDREEKDLRDQQAYFNLIVKNKGKEDVADRQYQEMLNLRDTKKNIGEKSIEWAIYANKDFNVHVRKFGFQNTRVWFLEAIQAWSDEFEDQFSDAYELQIEDWRATSNGDDLDRLADNIKEHLEKNKFKTKYVNKFNFISLLMIIGGVLSGIFLGPNIDFEYFKLISYGLSLVFLVVLIVRIATAGSRFRKKVNMTMSVFNGLAQEITLYRETYFKNRDKKMTLLSLIEHL